MSDIIDNKETYNFFSKYFFNELSSIPTLFHYCSVDTFYRIIQNKEIWLTDPKYMNDYFEQHYLDGIIDEILVQIRKKKLYKEDVISLFCDYYKSYSASSNYFYCCFSSKGDLLSQWCRYADDGRGFSIGFSPKSWGINYGIPIQVDAIPIPNNQLMINKIHYCSENIKSDIEKFVICVLDFIKNKDPNISVNGSYFSAILCSLRNIIKNPAFSEESEHRIIFNDPSDYVGVNNFGFTEDKFNINKYLKNYNFRIKNNSISRYYPLSFSSGFIEQIFIGPKNVSLENDIKDFLELNKITNVKIHRSSASYR